MKLSFSLTGKLYFIRRPGLEEPVSHQERKTSRIASGGDHAGFELKKFISVHHSESAYEILDVGALEYDGEDDYPDFARLLAEAVMEGKADKGILICGSGVGASVTANKIRGIRACLCHDTYSARQGVEHDDMNVICIGGRIIGIELTKVVLQAFLGAVFVPEPRFQRRLDKIIQVEQNGLI